MPAPRVLSALLVVGLATLAPRPAQGQQFTGTFTVPNQAGGMMTLTLREAGGGVTGSLASNGVTYEVQGQIEDGTLVGVMSGTEGGLYFAAERWENELWVELYGVDANGQPDFDDSTEIDFVLAESTSGAVAPSESAPPAAAAAPSVTASQGSAGAGRTSTGRELAAGFTEDHPQVREWVDFLAGKKLTRMSSYSSGGAGGYSARTDLYLCSDRSFALRDESSVSVDVGGAFGNSGGVGGSQGRWYVITNGQVVGLVLEATSGEVSEFRLDYQNQETYANGERVYVTPAEVCMQ
jgi:hypothetical protein